VSQDDWTSVESQKRIVKPLTAETFVQRLELLSARAQDIQKLRAAMQLAKEKK
jgi:AmiR/NasT family two-component response regulator